MAQARTNGQPPVETRSLLLSRKTRRMQRLAGLAGQGLLFLVTSLSTLTVFFIFYFIARDAFPFFRLEGFREFFLSTSWYPSADEPHFGALAIFVGSGMVTLGAVVVAVPLGIAAAICLSDVLPFTLRQFMKPVVEVLAAIPSVAFGFFALVVFAPKLQESGGSMLSLAAWLIGAPLLGLLIFVAGDLFTQRLPERYHLAGRIGLSALLASLGIWLLVSFTGMLKGLEISSGTNALNVSVILGIMALPTIVSVSEDALQAVGRDLREGSYALGATRAETLVRMVLPAAISGLFAAVILGVMRAIGETMVVWMASGNAAHIPDPWYNYLEPVRTLTATIAGDMGEADQTTGSARFHVLFAMGFCLLLISFAMNLMSEWIVQRSRRKLRG